MNYFEQQQDNKLLASEDVIAMKGKPLYGKYEEGDKVYFIMTQEYNDFRIEPIVERTLDKLYNEYNFVRMASTMTVFEKK
jgi:hypothetical protein